MDKLLLYMGFNGIGFEIVSFAGEDSRGHHGNVLEFDVRTFFMKLWVEWSEVIIWKDSLRIHLSLERSA